ncbi:hypothetical protein ACFE04_020413 [Oxalis oulophora]
MAKQQNDVVVAMVPFPAQGHLNQLLHLSRLVLSYNIPVHYLGSSIHIRQVKHRVQGWDPDAVPDNNIHFHDLEIPSFHSPPPDPNAKVKFPSHLQQSFDASIVHLRGSVGELLRSLACNARKVIIIYDSLMKSVIQDVEFIPNAETYSFTSISAFTCCLFLMDKIGDLIDSSLIDQIPYEIPSLKGCFSDEFATLISSQYEINLNFISGSIYNTSGIIETTYMKLMEQNPEFKKHWALGPFNPVTVATTDDSRRRHHCFEWLDKKPPNSVVLVSFGTTTTLSDQQINQIAIGLKQSDKNFIWVLRDADKGNIFSDGEVRKAVLPEGYEDSVKEKGVIIRDWAPQLEILANPCVGGFVSHCGWNSCMESLTMGVPIGTWPMHSDQPRNSVLITEVLKVGIAVKKWDMERDEILSAADVENGVKMLMEGDEMRERAAELGRKVRESVADGGVTRAEFDDFIAHITR